MNKELVLGISHTTTLQVEYKDSAASYGSGLIEVFATPAMIGMMENTAHLCVQPALPEGSITVGTEVNIQHMKATPLGMSVHCTATLVEIDGKKLRFNVEAFDEQGMIGKGTHTRFVVDSEKFMKKLLESK